MPHLSAVEWLAEDPRLNRLADQVIELGLGSAEQAAAAAAAVSPMCMQCMCATLHACIGGSSWGFTAREHGTPAAAAAAAENCAIHAQHMVQSFSAAAAVVYPLRLALRCTGRIPPPRIWLAPLHSPPMLVGCVAGQRSATAVRAACPSHKFRIQRRRQGRRWTPLGATWRQPRATTSHRAATPLRWTLLSTPLTRPFGQ